MINGIPINDQSTTQGLHDFGVDFLQTIQQIEIFLGQVDLILELTRLGEQLILY